MSEINFSKWKFFSLGDDSIFNIQRGQSKYIKDMAKGDIPYISTSQKNNGIASYVSDYNRDGNQISLAYDGTIGACFYQSKPFFASEKIVTISLKNRKLNKYLATFLIEILKKEAEMYKYGGRKWTVEKNLKKTNVFLPALDDKTPDFDFMEKFVKDREEDIKNIPDYFLNDGFEKACWYLDHINPMDFEKNYAGCLEKGSKPLLNPDEWKVFPMEELFAFEASKGDIQLNKSIPGDIPLVSSTKYNNGYAGFISEGDGKAETFDGNCITIDMFGSVFYQPKTFFSVSHGRILILKPKFKFNAYIGLFIACVLQHECSIRFPYGRMVTKGNINTCKLKLPVDKKGKLDFDFMEQTIKKSPFSIKIS